MIGHQKLVEDLKDLATRGELGHGYLFFGPAMVGKKLAALSFANFLEKGEFGEDGILSDLMLIGSHEGGSIGIDVVREVKNFLWQKPNASPRRTLIIDDADLLTTEAQNALLKITEEPPASSLIVLITSDTESILPTILSRLEKLYFGIVPEKEIAAWLASADGRWQMADGKKLPNLTKIKATELAKQVFGKPGLAMRLLTNEAFRIFEIPKNDTQGSYKKDHRARRV